MNSCGRNTKNKDALKPKIAIIGGSGMCTFDEIEILARSYKKNIYGLPSDEILIGNYGGALIAFLPRHGHKHSIPPHKIPYKANIQALKELGIQYIIGTCIAGSLKKKIKPGSIVIPDQFINFTCGRDNYYAIDKKFIHLPMAEPYCETLRKIFTKNARLNNSLVFSKATVVVIQGPRFSTKAESKWFMSNGWDIVNMTQYPESYFAKEAGMCYSAFATITDYDVGLHRNLTINPRAMPKILRIFHDNIKKTKECLLLIVGSLKIKPVCNCGKCAIQPYYKK